MRILSIVLFLACVATTSLWADTYNVGIGNVPNRTINERLQDIVIVNDWPSLASAVRDIGGAKRTLFIPAGTYTVSENLTIPANISLIILMGGAFEVSTGKTLTINGEITAPVDQIFSGSGTIVFGGEAKQIYPDWWGVDGKADNVQINKAIATLRDGDIFAFGANRTYNIDKVLSVPTSNYLHVKGNNATIKTTSNIGRKLIFGTRGKYVTIEDLNINGEIGNTRKYTGSIGLAPIGAHTTLKRCTVKDVGGTCIRLAGAYGYAEDCEADGTHDNVNGRNLGKDGFRVSNEFCEIKRCVARNAKRWPIEARSHNDSIKPPLAGLPQPTNDSWIKITDCRAEDRSMDIEVTNKVIIDNCYVEKSICCNGTRDLVIKNSDVGGIYKVDASPGEPAKAPGFNNGRLIIDNCTFRCSGYGSDGAIRHFKFVHIKDSRFISSETGTASRGMLSFDNVEFLLIENSHFDGRNPTLAKPNHMVPRQKFIFQRFNTSGKVTMVNCLIEGFSSALMGSGSFSGLKVSNCVVKKK